LLSARVGQRAEFHDYSAIESDPSSRAACVKTPAARWSSNLAWERRYLASDEGYVSLAARKAHSSGLAPEHVNRPQEGEHRVRIVGHWGRQGNPSIHPACIRSQIGSIVPKMRTVAHKPVRSAVAAALLTPVQQRVLGLLFGQPERRFQSAELIRLAGSGTEPFTGNSSASPRPDSSA